MKKFLIPTCIILGSCIIITPAKANDKKIVNSLNQFYSQENKDIKQHYRTAKNKADQLDIICSNKLQDPNNAFIVSFLRFQYLTVDYQVTHRRNLNKLEKTIKPYRKKIPQISKLLKQELKTNSKVSSAATSINTQIFCDNVDNKNPDNPLNVLNGNMSFTSKNISVSKDIKRLQKYKLNSQAIRQLKKSLLTIGFTEKQSRELGLLQ